ncbi:MAG: FAD:protein FMN transferase [Flavobacteriaceae bacterium]|nr:FAD:protein FMN transferase [Flavobacteriaceae bacterium]
MVINIGAPLPLNRLVLKHSLLTLLRRFISLSGILFCLCCQESVELTSIKGQALGTTYQIKLDSKSLDPSELTKRLDSIFSIVNHSMSTYVPTSIISKVNSENTSITVDAHFEHVFRSSQEIWKKTNGYFDPTVGPLVDAYGFGPQGIQKLNQQHIDSLKQFIGLDKVSIDHGVLTKQNAEISLDFNAIAKGYTVDIVGQYLNDLQVENFLIELGGEVLVQGMNPQSKTHWSIGIENPILDSLPRILKVVELKNQAQATSGNYRKFWVDSLSGKRYVHTINPITGLIQDSKVLSVSVIAQTCTQADAMATALLAMPFKQGKALIQREKDFEALWIYTDNTQVATHQSPGFGL